MKREGNPSPAAAVATANLTAFSANRLSTYEEGAPHLMHPTLRRKLLALLRAERNRTSDGHLRVLDLGAGEGSVTRFWLELGAEVTAVDLSPGMLTALQGQCAQYGSHLRCVVAEANEFVRTHQQKYDVLSFISFLHHIPDYKALLAEASRLVQPGGAMITFADPMRYDSLPRTHRLFSLLAYAIWRMGRPDLFGGLKRRVRRALYGHNPISVFDNAEYHVTRGGVDPKAISELLAANGFSVNILPYWATQSRAWQRIGERLCLNSDFALVARKGRE